MGTYFNHSELATVQVTSSTTWALALIAVVLRFTARRMSRSGLWYDDYTILIALAGGLGLWLNFVIWMSKPLDNPTDSTIAITRTLKCTFIANLLWIAALSSTKVSILSLYLRLFAQQQSSRWIIRIFILFVFCWGFIGFLVCFLRCRPISTFWEKYQEGCPRLGNTHGEYLITHTVIDILILILPLPMMSNLDLRLKHKVMLCGVFSLGILLTVVSGLRLKYQVLDAGPQSWRLMATKSAIWNCVEANTAVLCACLPCLRPIISYVGDKLRVLRKQKRPTQRGTELLFDMLPRREHQQVSESIQPHEILEIDLAYEQIDLRPQEIDTTQRPLPEMEAVQLRAFELPSLDMGPVFGLQPRELASNMV